MKPEFKTYLESIGLTGQGLFERIENIYEFYNEIIYEEISDIFISDYLKEDKSREYESLWFFSDNYCMEADNFLNQENFDCTNIKNKIQRWEIKKQDYDINEATENSRLYLFFNLGDDITGELKATKENCDSLIYIFHKYIKSNLK